MTLLSGAGGGGGEKATDVLVMLKVGRSLALEVGKNIYKHYLALRLAGLDARRGEARRRTGPGFPLTPQHTVQCALPDSSELSECCPRSLCPLGVVWSPGACFDSTLHSWHSPFSSLYLLSDFQRLLCRLPPRYSHTP